jgi:hypothetical protein
MAATVEAWWDRDGIDDATRHATIEQMLSHLAREKP